jgi:hypothetical protein
MDYWTEEVPEPRSDETENSVKTIIFEDVKEICKYRQHRDYGGTMCLHRDSGDNVCDRLECPVWDSLRTCQRCI